MALGDAIGSFSNGLGNAFFPTDPSLNVNPQYAQTLKNNSLIQLGLGIMAAPYSMRGFGAGMLDAMNGAQQSYGTAMSSAFRNSLMRQEADYQQQERGLQLKTQGMQLQDMQRQERQNSAITAQRVLAGLSSSTNPSAQWDLIKTDPSVQKALADLQVQGPDTSDDPNQFEAFKQKLADAAGIEAPPPKPMVLPQGASVVGVSPTGAASTLISGGQKVRYVDNGADLVPVDAFTGQPVPGVKPIPKKLPPGMAFDPTSVENTAQMIANGQMPMITGFSLKTPWGQAVLSRVKEINPNYSAIDYASASKATTTAAAIAGKVGYAENEILRTAPLALQASSAVPRTNFVPLAKLEQLGEKNVNDPALRQFMVYNQSLINAYEMLAARSGTDANKREHIEGLLRTADTPESYQAAVQAIIGEAKASQSAGEASARLAPGYTLGRNGAQPTAPKGTVNAATLMSYASKYHISMDAARAHLTSQGYAVQ